MHFDNYFIRLLTGDDIDPFFNLIEENRIRLEAFFSGTVARTRNFGDTKLYLDEILIKIANKTYLPFVIVDQTTNSFAGFIDIKNIDWNIPKGELGCFIDKNYEGKGLGKKSFTLFTRYCLSDMGFKKLFLRTHETNLAAKKLAESCGFTIEGKLRRDYKTTEGELVDLLYYGQISDSV